MLTVEYSRILKKIPLQFFIFEFSFLKISSFLKDNYNWCQNCQVPCHFFGGEFWSLGDQKLVMQLLQSICLRKKWPIVSRF
jgi:hypothetical protein